MTLTLRTTTLPVLGGMLAATALALAGSPAAFAAEASNPMTSNSPGLSPSSGSSSAITPEKYNEMVKYMRTMYDAMGKLNKRLAEVEKSGGKGKGAKAKDGAEETVDLGETPTPVQTASDVKSPHGPSRAGAEPTFKVFFDLDLVAKPGVEDFSFDNFHSFLFFEIIPTPDLMFSFDISASPRFYELDYNITPKLQIRAGRIWIPFDDLSPHNIFGGRVNVSRLNPASNPTMQFLPDIWTDLGIGFRYQLVDTSAFQSVAHLYAVNGFRDGGTDPSSKTAGQSYPNFSSTVLGADNNTDKSIGARVHTMWARRIGLGVSYFRGSWTPSTATAGKGLSMLGVDGQLRLGPTEFRAGLASMNVDLPSDTMSRGGVYAEISQKFGGRQQFRFLARGGTLQLDNRVFDVTDQLIVGGALVYSPGMIELWTEYSQDLKVVTGKVNYSYAAARLVVAL